MKRWETRCKRCVLELFYDGEGNLLDEKPKDPREVAMRKKISESRNKFEDIIQMAKTSEQGMDFLYSSLSNLVEPLQKITPATRVDKQEEYESFLGNRIPTEVDIHPPNDIRSKGRSKRIRRSKDKEPKKRKCRKCKQLVDHDARNCPNNVL
ncbi:hypothetical protein PVAP13_9NG402000 [Panicum virgatum]|uniref:Uncharacterized protein n=1 Tax=Panicum virgatum TaxID=38727 RepID=A0A8T0MST2_PANVG|nr:hypothetical protein PVAP13_9NG402000 [Panicum virgatum]